MVVVVAAAAVAAGTERAISDQIPGGGVGMANPIPVHSPRG